VKVLSDGKISIIGVEDSEVDFLFTHLALGLVFHADILPVSPQSPTIFLIEKCLLRSNLSKRSKKH